MAEQRTGTDDRIRLCEALWNLRCGIARIADGEANTVTFGRMLTDPGYRARIIRRVRQSDSPELRRLAEEAARHNVGQLAETAVSWEAARRTGLDLGEADSGIQAASQQRPWVRASVLGATTLALLVSIVGGVAGYLFSPQVAAVLAGDHRVAGPITGDTTWESERTHVLTERVYVTNGARLTIEAGARIRGESGSALIVTADASLHARGQRDAPITFSSAEPKGERNRGDWGGVVLLGRAPVNASDPRVEGVAQAQGRARFGGSAVDDSCGVLEYVRIAHAGYELAANDELNGLTLAGCGNRTLIGHVQVRQALDDGIEIFGGTVDLKYILVSGAGDDSLDWDLGWRGRAQHLVLVQSPAVGDNGIEADNNRDAHRAQPRSGPTLANLTLLSPPSANGQRRALLLRRGTGLDLRNALVAGFNHELLDVRDKATSELAASGELTLRGLVASEVGEDGHTWAVTEKGESDDDAGFDEGQLLRAAGNRLGTEVKLLDAIDTGQQPAFAPDAAGTAARVGVALPEGEFWNRDAQFAGAVRPGRVSSWLADWTAWPSE